MTLKDRIETAEATVTIIAILVGGLWAYNLFIKERKNYPHVNIAQNVSHVALSSETNLLRVGIELTNSGACRMLSAKAIIRIQQILPVPACPKQGPCAKDEIDGALKEVKRQANRFSWPLIAEREHTFEKPLDTGSRKSSTVSTGEEAPGNRYSKTSRGRLFGTG